MVMENIFYIGIAGVLFALLGITKKKKTKKTIFWILMGYLLLLGVLLK